MTNETLETIKNRRSCRAYKPEQITDEELNADYVLPGAFDERVADAIADAVSAEAVASGVCRPIHR